MPIAKRLTTFIAFLMLLILWVFVIESHLLNMNTRSDVQPQKDNAFILLHTAVLYVLYFYALTLSYELN